MSNEFERWFNNLGVEDAVYGDRKGLAKLAYAAGRASLDDELRLLHEQIRQEVQQ